MLGTYQLGDLVPLSVWCLNANRLPVEPNEAPEATIVSASGAVAVKLPIRDRANVTGFFQDRLSLGPGYVPGTYSVVCKYTIGATAYATVQHFQIVPGGHQEGTGISCFFFRQPQSDYVLMQTDQGKVKRMLNPEVT